jgi:hypothetical protein
VKKASKKSQALSAAKDLDGKSRAIGGAEILRFAQDDNDSAAIDSFPGSQDDKGSAAIDSFPGSQDDTGQRDAMTGRHP